MHKNIFLLALLLTASAIFTGCRNDDYEPEIPEAIVVADPKSLEQTVSADEKTGASTVEFTTLTSWTSSITEVPTTQSTRDASEMWVSISPSSGGAGNHEIEISLLPNTTGADRTVIITITSGGEDIQIRITQRYVRADGTIAVTGVTLNESALELTVGETETLIATVTPDNATNQAVTWSTSDAAIADVDADGMVTAVSVGTATITATTVDGAHTATATVTVMPIAVTDITLDRSTLQLALGETETLIATVVPDYATNQAVTWLSSDEDIATVANGIITAVAAGTATITATTEDGNFTATATINILDGVRIDGTIWATRNVDAPGTFAALPTDAGMFYQLNRRTGWASTGYIVSGWDRSTPTGTTWYAENDPCPTGWRVPTPAELQSLHNAGSTWTTLSGVNGRLYGTAPNQIFLPAAGCRTAAGGTLVSTGAYGYYRSNAPHPGGAAWSLGLSFGSTRNSVVAHPSAAGFSVRCVAE